MYNHRTPGAKKALHVQPLSGDRLLRVPASGTSHRYFLRLLPLPPATSPGYFLRLPPPGASSKSCPCTAPACPPALRLSALRLSARLPPARPPHQLSGVRLDHTLANAGVHKLSVALRFHQSRLYQFLHVVRNRRLGDRKPLAQLLIRALLLSAGDRLQDRETARIGERLGDPLELPRRKNARLTGLNIHG